VHRAASTRSVPYVADGAAEAEAGAAEAAAAEAGGPPEGDIGQRIQDALASTNPGEALEGQVAQGLQDAGVSIEQFQAEVGTNGSIGELDVVTDRAIIEVTTSPSGKLAQITKLLTNTQMNPLGKPVILYAPNYGGAAGTAITSTGAYVARSMAELLQILAGL
jgi:hypothetical protein